MSLATARDHAADLRRVARAGGDPRLARRRSRAGTPTFRGAATQLHATHAATFKNPKHTAQWLQSLVNDVFPMIGDRPVDTITSADVLAVLTPIWLVKPETARRITQRIKAVLQWATAAGYRSPELANPVDGVARVLPRHKGDKAHHPALPYAQVPAFLEQVRAADAGTSTKLALEFLILTASRTNEVLGARWDEVDHAAQVWTVPGVRMKSGRPHRVPLAGRCLDLLDQAAAIAGDSPFVFPGRDPQRPLSNMALLMLLRRLGRDDIVVHGFRSSFRDWAEEKTRFPRSVCESALAHVLKDRVEAAYLRSDLLDQRRPLMEAWAAFTAGTVATVLPLRA